MASPKPTILLIHGAWHTPEHYEALRARLTALGYATHFPALPTCKNVPVPDSTVDDDVTYIRQIAQQLISEGKSIVALMHSYGGIVGTAALSVLGASATAAAAAGQPGVVALVYMSAFIPFEDESLAGIFGGELPPFLTPNPDTGFIDVDDPQHHFFSGLPPHEQERCVSLLVPHPTVAQTKPASGAWRAAWRGMSGRVWYLLCEKDESMLASVQQWMVDRLEKESVVVNVVRFDSGHSPWLKMPEAVVGALQNIGGVASG